MTSKPVRSDRAFESVARGSGWTPWTAGDRSLPRDHAGPDVSVVIPVFDEEENVPILLAEIEAVMSAGDREYEIVAVDDCSTDRSFALLRSAAASSRRLRLLSTPRRLGQSAALAAGIRAARAPVVITCDADLQNDPKDIPRLLEALETCDVVSGIRRDRQDTRLRRVSSLIANLVRRRLLDDGIHDVGCSLKAYRRELLVGLPPFNGMHRFLPALARLQGARVREIEVNHRPRRFGRSKYGIANRLGRGIVDLLGVLWLKKRWIDLSSFRE